MRVVGGTQEELEQKNGDDKNILYLCVKSSNLKKKHEGKRKKRIIPNGPLVSQLLTTNLVLND